MQASEQSALRSWLHSHSFLLSLCFLLYPSQIAAVLFDIISSFWEKDGDEWNDFAFLFFFFKDGLIL